MIWFPVLGVVCVGLFVGAAVTQFKQHKQQHSDRETAPPPGEAAVDHEGGDEAEPE